MSSNINPETMKLVEEAHNMACDCKKSNLIAIDHMETLYKRLLSEICNRDKRIAELEEEIEEQVNVIIGQKNELSKRY